MTIQTMRAGDGCGIAWTLDGPEDAPVLVLAHLLGGSMAMWAPQVEALRDRFRLLRYDARGHGASDAPPGSYGLDRLGRDVIELLDSLDIARASFCGLSMGGVVGQWLGVRAPERLDRLVLANTAAWLGPVRSWDDRIAIVRAEGMAPMADAVLPRWLTPAYRAAHPAVEANVRAMVLRTDPVGYAGCCAALRDMDMRPTNALITVPTQVIAAREDGSTSPEAGRALADSISESRFALLEAAHLSNIEQAAAFSAVLADFLSA